MPTRSEIVLVLVLAACDRPRPLVICHNANCSSPDTSRDDTLPALEESLALTFDGTIAVDGVEWDTFWFGAENRCLFAHDLDGDTTVPASAAAEVVAAHLRFAPRINWSGDRFYAFIELKGFVGDSFSDEHTPAQREMHADCALDSLGILLAAARDGGHPLTVGLISIRPALLEALTQRPQWAAFASEPDLELMLVADIFAPFNSIVPTVADYNVPLDAVEFHPRHMNAQHREAYRALGLDLVQWSFVTTSESFRSIQRWEPRFVLTNEATLLRGWIEN